MSDHVTNNTRLMLHLTPMRLQRQSVCICMCVQGFPPPPPPLWTCWPVDNVYAHVPILPIMQKMFSISGFFLSLYLSIYWTHRLAPFQPRPAFAHTCWALSGWRVKSLAQRHQKPFFLGHCFSLKEIQDNKHTYPSTSNCFSYLGLQGKRRGTTHPGQVTNLSHGQTHTHTLVFIFIGLRTSRKPQHTPCCVFYSSSLKVTWINHKCVPQVVILDSERAAGEGLQTALRVTWK